mmetsp:Transcript_119431/g.345387  ORF Transcript_119431/g.345387 Transcript_119431/m.345387 type:complete len:279 (+) Transcript_119431:194-1030(+)
MRRLHDVPPQAVVGLEAPRFRGQLPRDVNRVEDRLQVQPIPLATPPLLERLQHVLQLRGPLVDLCGQIPLEGGVLQHLGGGELLVQKRRHDIHALQDVGVGVAVLLRALEGHTIPLRPQVLQLPLDSDLLRRPLRNRLQALDMVLQLVRVGAEVRQVEAVHLRANRGADQLGDLVPMPLSHTVGAQSDDQGHGGDEGVQLLAGRVGELDDFVVRRVAAQDLADRIQLAGTLVDLLLQLLGVDLVEVALLPPVAIPPPASHDGPQVAEGAEGLRATAEP